jgi:hypothetical protein
MSYTIFTALLILFFVGILSTDHEFLSFSLAISAALLITVPFVDILSTALQ